eukprot:scaffold2964_cov24-Tisochrysis_lutea.AAC.1
MTGTFCSGPSTVDYPLKSMVGQHGEGGGRGREARGGGPEWIKVERRRGRRERGKEGALGR